jgi:hypothetical protein
MLRQNRPHSHDWGCSKPPKTWRAPSAARGIEVQGLGALGAGGDEGAPRPLLPAPQPVAVGDIPRINGIIMKRYSK